MEPWDSVLSGLTSTPEEEREEVHLRSRRGKHANNGQPPVLLVIGCDVLTEQRS